MTLTSQVQQSLTTLWWFLPLAILIGIAKSPWFKGLAGETFVKLTARLGLPKDVYQSIHNVTLATPDGTTQIDHVIVSRYGIFVIETKNMKGWIFGGEKQAQWTQKLYKQSYKFQNPLRQNYKHVKALQALLNLPKDSMHSIVVFSGEGTLKTPMPENVTTGTGYIRYIRSFNEPALSDEQVKGAAMTIESNRLEPSRQTHKDHVASLQQRQEPYAEPKCPACGNTMVVRTARRGPNAGSRFWACPGYPRCKTTMPIE